MAASPFGKATRSRALRQFEAELEQAVTAENAWEAVYRLLLSIDSRTGLAHVYDANHMQPGGNFHARAQRFSRLLCKRWSIPLEQLSANVDYMFRFCVEVYRKVTGTSVDHRFVDAVRKVLAERLAVPGDVLEEAALAIDQVAEDFYRIGKKRANVRGEGFEDVLCWLLTTVADVPAGQLRTRISAGQLPGFRTPERQAKPPKPDIAVVSQDGALTMSIITVKWSLRQDRLDQFGQEWEYYKGHKVQQADVWSFLVTNEMDIARLRDVLSPHRGAGGFHFHCVYHVNLDLLREMQEDRFEPLEHYMASGRLKGLRDLLNSGSSLW